MASYGSFEELDCWKKCRKVRIWVEELINNKISKHDFDMIQNIRRAARSSTRNIAEGFGRHHHKENIQFCRISRGSLFEIKEDLNICCDEGNLKKEDIQD
ncbi:MAG: four helix bundle protein [Bacteroidia bacterium]|nr:four helix bundle protein [Bacteroidia bacterium]